MSKKQYSPITKLYIKNFRNIGEATIDFTDSPIVSLIGDNEAGKTSVVKAFAVCALHADPRSQKDFIRDGTNGFGVAIELADGTIVRRMKAATSNSYTIIKPDGSSWELGKTESTIPKPIQDIMGLKEEPETKEFLHIRTYEDRLLFVSTPASVNYKVMYDALKIDDITSAIKNGNSEVNKLRQEISVTESGIDTLTDSLRAIRVYDITHLLNIKSRLLKEQTQVQKLAEAVKLKEKIDRQKDQLGALSKLTENGNLEINEHEYTMLSSINRLRDSISACTNQLGALSELMNGNVSEIDETQVSKITSVQRVLDTIDSGNRKIQGLLELENTDYVNIDPLLKLITASERQTSLEANKSKAGTMLELDKASEIDTTELDHLMKAVSLNEQIRLRKEAFGAIDVSGASLIEQSDFNVVMKASAILTYRDRINEQNNTKKQCDDYCKQMSDYLKAIGVAVEVCPNCGEQVVIDMDKIQDKV